MRNHIPVLLAFASASVVLAAASDANLQALIAPATRVVTDHARRLQFQLANVLDKHYESAQHFNQPERSLFLMLRCHPITL